ncbi:MAG: DUF4411 family protein [Spirosomataceae bacterium]
MKVVIDTSSLLALVRYYLPFDKKGVLFQFIKLKIENGDIILIDKVLQECGYNSKGLVLSKLPYLTDKVFLKASKVPFKTELLFAPNTRQFLHQLNNNFVNKIIKKAKGFTESEFESEKSRFVESADLKLVILALKLKNEGEQVVLVTEETASSNDNKLFKKIPAICNELEIETIALPALIAKYDGIDFYFQ